MNTLAPVSDAAMNPLRGTPGQQSARQRQNPVDRVPDAVRGISALIATAAIRASRSALNPQVELTTPEEVADLTAQLPAADPPESSADPSCHALQDRYFVAQPAAPPDSGALHRP